MHPGCLYIHSVHEGISLEEHDQKLDAHKEATKAKARRDKENIPPTRPIKSFFFTSKIPSQENPTPTQEQVEEKLEVELFPETLEILFESESKDDLNSMISMLREGGTEVPDVTDDIYEKLLRKREIYHKNKERARKRAAGEDVPVCPTGAPPVKLTASQRAEGGRRSCLGENCTNNIQFPLGDGSGEGWCFSCAPADIKSSKYCSEPGCERFKKFDGKCASHVDPANERYIASKKREAERHAKRRKNK
jgi:hypothetical protein